MESAIAHRDPGSRPLKDFYFKPGKSANPGGYSRAHRDAWADVFAKQVIHTTEVMNALLEQALGGDSTAAATWLKRMFGPEAAPNFDRPVELHRQATTAEVLDVATQVLASHVGGLHEASKERRLTEDEVKRLLETVATLAKLTTDGGAESMPTPALINIVAPLLERYGYEVKTVTKVLP